MSEWFDDMKISAVFKGFSERVDEVLKSSEEPWTRSSLDVMASELLTASHRMKKQEDMIDKISNLPMMKGLSARME